MHIETKAIHISRNVDPANGAVSNPKRRHVRNGMLSPVEFERRQKR